MTEGAEYDPLNLTEICKAPSNGTRTVEQRPKAEPLKDNNERTTAVKTLREQSPNSPPSTISRPHEKARQNFRAISPVRSRSHGEKKENYFHFSSSVFPR